MGTIFQSFDFCAGNCWFLAAVASLCSSGNSQLIHKVIPADNSFKDKYAGVFRFKVSIVCSVTYMGCCMLVLQGKL